MYERFTDRARKVMQLANQEAQRFNHEYIGTEHILLGLVKEGSGVAANVLKNLEIDLRKIRLSVEEIVQSGPEMVTMGKLSQTPRARKVIEYSIEEARNLNHDYVGTEHLLLRLLREEEGIASQVLRNLGLRFDRLRKEVLAVLGQYVRLTRGQGPLSLGEETAVQRIARRTGELARRVLSLWRSRSGAGAEMPHLSDEVMRELDELVARIEEVDRQKEVALAEQDFEQAASLRDEADKLIKRFQALIRDTALSGESKEYELLVGRDGDDAGSVPQEVFDYIEKQLRERFSSFARSERQVFGELKLGDATFRDRLVAFTVVAPEVEHPRDFFRQLKENLKSTFKLQTVAVLVKELKGEAL